jgi:hypothetical protein
VPLAPAEESAATNVVAIPRHDVIARTSGRSSVVLKDWDALVSQGMTTEFSTGEAQL